MSKVNKDILLGAIKLRTTNIDKFDDAFYVFVKTFWNTIIPEQMDDNFHIKYLCGEIQKWASTIIKNEKRSHHIVINIPPGQTKTTICSIMAPAWIWTMNPTIRFITASYNIDLATANAVSSKDILTDSKYRLLYGNMFNIREDFDSKGHFKNDKGGERLVTSVGAKVTGFHAHVKIIDDGNNPVNLINRELFDKDNFWYDRTFRSRNVDEEKTIMLVVQQRLASNDITSHIVKKEKDVKHIILPCSINYEIKPKNLISFYEKGLLNPRRLSEQRLADILDVMGQVDFDYQYGQKNKNEGAGIVDEDDFEIIEARDVPFEVFTSHVAIYVDTNMKIATKSDYTGIMVTVKYGFVTYVLEYIKKKYNYIELKAALKEVYQKYSINDTFNSYMVIEQAALGVAAIEDLRSETDINIIEYPKPNDSKLSRFNACTTKIKAGKIKLVSDKINGTGWNKKYRDEVIGFPNLVNDEAVDCTIMCIQDQHSGQELMQDGYERKYSLL